MYQNGYVYVQRNHDRAITYVGKGSRARPYEEHNAGFEGVARGEHDFLITPMPFSSKDDAEMSESLVIRALFEAQQHGIAMTNLAQRLQSKHLVPLVPVAEGTLDYASLGNAVIVRIRPERIDSRDVISGVTPAEVAAERCRQYWPIGSCVARDLDVRLLVAVTSKVKPARVLGVWETQPVAAWDSDAGAIALTDPAAGDVGGHRGKVFDRGGYAFRNFGYSADLRD